MDLNAVIEQAIESLVSKAVRADQAHEATNLTQAALNLANARAVLEATRHESERNK